MFAFCLINFLALNENTPYKKLNDSYDTWELTPTLIQIPKLDKFLYYQKQCNDKILYLPYTQFFLPKLFSSNYNMFNIFTNSKNVALV